MKIIGLALVTKLYLPEQSTFAYGDMSGHTFNSVKSVSVSIPEFAETGQAYIISSQKHKLFEVHVQPPPHFSAKVTYRVMLRAQ